MIRKLLTTTAIVSIAAGGAYAAEIPGAAEGQAEGQASDRFLTAANDASVATQIIGESVYIDSAEDAEAVGEINDLLVGSEGEIDAAIIGVGGFLGLGEKNVAVSYDELELIEDDDGTYHVVLETSREELEAAPTFDVSAVTARDRASTEATGSEGQADEQMAAEEQPRATDDRSTAREPTATDDRMAATDPAADEPAADGYSATTSGRQDYAIVEVSEMGTDELIGAGVYSYNDENIGEIGEVILTDDGKTDAIIIDVGGFLGIGEKPVAVAFEDLEFRADESGTLYIFTQFTQEQLETAVEYNEEEYEQNRDQMRLRSAG